MNVSSVVQSGASVQTRENGRPRLSRQAPVLSRPDEAGPSAGEVAGEQQRVVLADDAVGRVRPVEPVHADADHRIVDGPELLDGLVRLREEAFDQLRLAPEFAQRALKLLSGGANARESTLVGERPSVPRPVENDFFFLCHGGSSLTQTIPVG